MPFNYMYSHLVPVYTLIFLQLVVIPWYTYMYLYVTLHVTLHNVIWSTECNKSLSICSITYTFWLNQKWCTYITCTYSYIWQQHTGLHVRWCTESDSGTSRGTSTSVGATGSKRWLVTYITLLRDSYTVRIHVLRCTCTACIKKIKLTYPAKKSMLYSTCTCSWTSTVAV